MERFVFVTAVTLAIIFGIGAVFGGPNFHFSGGDWDMDVEARGVADLVPVAPGSLAAQSYVGDRLRIRHVAANVVITPEDRTDFSVEIANPAGRAPMPSVEVTEGRVTIDGHLRGRIEDCTDGGARLRDYGDLSGADLPTITIRTPRNLEVDRSGAGTLQIAATESLDLDFSSCGTATVADVTNALDIDLAGSGRVTTGAARSLNADVAGSGELTTGAIAEGANIDIAGSGTVRLASLSGDLAADGAGSGNLIIDGGSVGEASVDLAGSGDVDITAPVRTLNVSIVGSGDVDVAGAVGDIEADIAGSGSVRAQSVTGSVRKDVWGSGDVRVGG
jgi:hypothetical protein